jgi:tyrosinase
MTRIRKDVWHQTRAEGDWPKALVAYERAVGLLRAADPPQGPPTDPLGWSFLAAIHGRATASGNADTSDALWCNCQHGSWFFLPWHRMYLLAFELIVQEVLGDDDWSLPYWYAVDPDDATSAVLPPAFREARTDNNLFTPKRSVLANGGEPLPDLGSWLVGALDAVVYSTPTGASTFGGGERARPSFGGDEEGLLEGIPHGAVHSLVGNDYDRNGNPIRRGWMGSFYTAGLDPVFWLHHANIDRLWQVWLDHDAAHVNPSGDPAWFDSTFSFPAAGGGLVTWSIGEVLDTTDLGYRYETTSAPHGVLPPVVVPPAGPGPGPDPGIVEEVPMPEPLPPQVLGATVDVPLASTAAVDVELSEPVDRGLGVAADDDAGGQAGAGRVYLRIEGVTGTAAAPMYQVYVNVPAGDDPEEHPELRAGLVSTFGLVEASQTNDVHDGSGLTVALDITPVRDLLVEQDRWDPGRLRVSFRPLVPTAASAEVAGLAAELEEAAEAQPADLRAGRITVITT